MYGDFCFTVFGTCTGDPEYSTLTSGTKRATVNLAVNTPRKQDDGSYTEVTTFVRLAFFGQAAERATIGWCKKGTAVYCRGSVSSYQQEVEGGKKFNMYNFRPDVFRPVGSGKPAQQQAAQGGQRSQQAAQSQGQGPDPFGAEDEFPDPFS